MGKEVPQRSRQHSPEEWLQLLRKAPGGYLLTNPKGGILRINDTLLEWLGYAREEVESKMKLQDFLPIGDKIFYETKHALLLKLQNEANEINYNFKCKDGQLKPVLLNSGHIKNDDGLIQAFQFVILPFSDRKKYEQDLIKAKNKSEEAAEAKSIFLSTITHEIRTPIHSILNAGNILLEEDPTPEQKELLEVINFSSYNLLELINSVLDLTKMERGKSVLKSESFAVRNLFQEMLKVYRPLASGKNVAFELHIDEAIPDYLTGDRGKIQQICTNLIGNAIKFTDRGTIQLSFILQSDSQHTCTVGFQFKDTGIGMQERELRKIFDPFTQANDSIHRKFGGTGLGLTIAQRLLKLLDSELSVQSTFGEGSVFSFDLVLQKSNQKEEPAQPALKALQADQIANMHILLVDDIYSNILIIKRYFKIWDIHFDYAQNGPEAIRKVIERPYDLIFMDINMPDMDGYQTTKNIRAQKGDRFKVVPIIALSAYDSSEVKYKVERSGMNGLMQKPFNADQLYRMILKYKNLSIQPVAIDQNEISFFQNESSQNIRTQNLCAFFGNDDVEIREYLKIATIELEKIKDEFALAENRYSIELFKSAVHKSTMILNLFQLDELRGHMNRGVTQLQNEDKAAFVVSSNEITGGVQFLIDWMKNHLKMEDAICAG